MHMLGVGEENPLYVMQICHVHGFTEQSALIYFQQMHLGVMTDLSMGNPVFAPHYTWTLPMQEFHQGHRGILPSVSFHTGQEQW